MKSVVREKGGWQIRIFRSIAALVMLGIFSTHAGAQSFSVRNPKDQAWPKEDAEKIYKFASQVVEQEFKPRQAVHPQFTLVLGYEKNQMDVNSNELRLTKWDRRLFTEGVILFGFEQMLSNDTKIRMVKRALKQSDSVLSVNEAQRPSCSPGSDCEESASSRH